MKREALGLILSAAVSLAGAAYTAGMVSERTTALRSDVAQLRADVVELRGYVLQQKGRTP